MMSHCTSKKKGREGALVYTVYLVNSNILNDPSSDNWPYAINLKLIDNIWISFKFFVVTWKL